MFVAAVTLAFALALTEADSPMLLWLLVGGIMALGPVIHSYIKVYEWFKGKGVDASQFVTRDELNLIRKERDHQIAETMAAIRADVDSIEKAIADMSKDFAGIHRALGRVEGHDEVELRRAR